MSLFRVYCMYLNLTIFALQGRCTVSLQRSLAVRAAPLYLEHDSISGLLAMDVYFAYNNSSALTMAQSLWSMVFRSQVQQDQAASGYLLGFNVSFSSSCSNGMFLCVTGCTGPYQSLRIFQDL